MQRPGEPALSFHLYPLLPYELRLAIIESWLWDRTTTGWFWLEHYRGRARLAEYATIDRQWKSVIEKYTFECLTLPFDKIHHLERVCVEDRMRAFLALDLNITLKKIRSWRTESSIAVTHGTTNSGSNTHYDIDQSLINTKRVEAAENLIPILDRFQESGLRILDIAVYSEDLSPWDKATEPELYTPPSIRLSQALVALTCRLKVLRLINVVDVPYLLKESSRANENASSHLPTWPNLRSLSLDGYTVTEPADLRGLRSRALSRCCRCTTEHAKTQTARNHNAFPILCQWEPEMGRCQGGNANTAAR